MAAETFATGINNADEIVGACRARVQGFLYTGGTFTGVSDPSGDGSAALLFGINNAGDMVGSHILVRWGTEWISGNTNGILA